MEGILGVALAVVTAEATLMLLFAVFIGPRVARRLVLQDTTDPNGAVRKAIRDDFQAVTATARPPSLSSDAARELAGLSVTSRQEKAARALETEADLVAEWGTLAALTKEFFPDLWEKAIGMGPMAKKVLAPIIKKVKEQSGNAGQVTLPKGW